jgi:hypothetical protein
MPFSGAALEPALSGAAAGCPQGSVPASCGSPLKNTALLSEVEISQAYEDKVARRDDLELVIPKREMEFDAAGNLKPFIA